MKPGYCQFLASETTIPLPIPIFIACKLATPVITRPFFVSIREPERGAIWTLGGSGLRRRNDQPQRQDTGKIHRPSRVRLVSMPDLNTVSIFDCSFKVVLVVATGDLVVRDVDTTLALGVADGVFRFSQYIFLAFVGSSTPFPPSKGNCRILSTWPPFFMASNSTA